MASLIWGEDESAMVRDAEELDALLDRLTREAEQGEPFVVELVGDAGASLSVGIGRPMSVANYVSASLEPPYLQSVGSSSEVDEISFHYQGAWSEYPSRCAIPVEQARAALRRFLNAEAAPDNIVWEEV